MRIKFGSNEKRFILIIFIVAFLLRAVLAIGYQWYVDVLNDGHALSPDESFYTAVGWYHALVFKGVDVLHLEDKHYEVMNPVTKELFKDMFDSYIICYGTTSAGMFKTRQIYSFVLGVLYAIFGYSVLLSRFLNILVGLLASVTIYFIAKSAFDKKVANISFILFAFLPLQIFLSISVIRDVLIIFIISLTLLLLYKVKSIKQLAISMILLLPMFYLLYYLQKSIFALLLMFFSISCLIKILDFRKHKTGSTITILIILAVFFVSGIFPYSYNFLYNSYYALFRKHIEIARDLDNLDNTTYRILSDRFYAESYFRFLGYKRTEAFSSMRGISGSSQLNIMLNMDILDREEREKEKTAIERTIFFNHMEGQKPMVHLKGFFYAFFKPFIWPIRKATQVFALVQMLFYYALFPFMCMGLYDSFRYMTKVRFMLIMFFFGFMMALALSEGNAGALLRHREIISFAYVIFGAAGLVKIFSNNKVEKTYG